MRQPSGRLAHALQPSRITQQRRDSVGKPYPFQFGFLDHHSRARPLQRLGVDSLMIIGCTRKRNENRRLPAAVISATVLAPERHKIKSARAKKAGMSVMNGKTSADEPAC